MEITDFQFTFASNSNYDLYYIFVPIKILETYFTFIRLMLSSDMVFFSEIT